MFLKCLRHPGTRTISNAVAFSNVVEIYLVVDPQLRPQGKSRSHSHMAHDHHFVYRTLRCPCADIITGQCENPWSFLPPSLKRGGCQASFLWSATSSFPLDAQEIKIHILIKQKLTTGVEPISYFSQMWDFFQHNTDWLTDWLIDDWNTIFI